MANPFQLSDAPDLTDKSVKRVYIKDGKRKFSTDTGIMYMPASQAKRLFGKTRGGKYSLRNWDGGGYTPKRK